jgi:hypothetical protein
MSRFRLAYEPTTFLLHYSAVIVHSSPKVDTYATASRFALNSFITVSALSPTLAIAASISGFDFLKRLHQYRANSLLEISTRFRALLADEVVSMTGCPL